MKTTTFKARAAYTSQSGLRPVVSQQEDTALGRNGEEGTAQVGAKPEHVTEQGFFRCQHHNVQLLRTPRNTLYNITQPKTVQKMISMWG